MRSETGTSNDLFDTVTRLWDEGRYDEAALMLEAAAAEAVSDTDEAAARIGLATTLKQKGDYTGAFAQFERVFKLASLAADMKQRAADALASLFLEVGQFEQAQQIATMGSDLSSLTLAALAQFVSGQQDIGYVTVEREIALASAAGNHVRALKRRAQLEMWRSLVYLRPGSAVAPADVVAASLDLISDCERKLAALATPEGHAAALEVIEYRGILLQAGGDLDGATAAMRDAVRAADTFGSIDQRARRRQILLVNLLNRALRGDADAAKEATEVVDALFALLIARASPTGLAAAAKLAALLDRQRGRLTNDPTCYRSAIEWLNHADRWLAAVRTRYWHPSASETDAARRELRTLARDCAGLAVEILAKDLQSPADVLEWAERTKAATLAELLGGVALTPPPGADPQLVQEEREALDALASSTTYAQVWKAQRTLERVWEALDHGGGDASDYVAMRRGRTIRYAELQSLLASIARETARDVLLVEYVAHGDQLLVIGMRSDRPDLTQRLLAVRLSDIEQDIREGIADPDKLDEVLARSSLLACAQSIVEWTNPGDIVCIVPAGPLFYVPLHAVSIGATPLITRNPVFYTPSATILRSCIQGRAAAQARDGAAVFSNPTGDLRYAETEASAVATLLGVTPVVGAAATRDRVLAAPSIASTVHFAGHAFFNSADPLTSGLVAAAKQAVTAREFFAIPRRPMRLVTLSACKTGVSAVDPGDEILGLTRALVHAGAVSLIMTLWEIDDKVSAVLMHSFYERWIVRGEAKIDALAGAQRDVIAAGHGHPSLWAAFTLIGDWF
jgi:CHAT domain-containing protein